MLLPSDTNRKPITSVTAVLLPFCDVFTDPPSYKREERNGGLYGGNTFGGETYYKRLPQRKKT
jgi:hypothetical protein